MATIAVTGATGFIGRHLLPLLMAHGHQVVAAGRKEGGAGRFAPVGAIGPETDWTAALADADAIIHLAGAAHGKASSAAEFQSVNDAGTRRLCEAAEAVGVRAIVQVSSIAARDAGGGPARLADYAASKLAAEGHVARFAERTGGAGISLRPPLVHGWDAPANWRSLQKLAASGVPLPFGGVTNRRSLCGVDNLCDALVSALDAGLRGAGSGVYEIADRETESLAGIVTHLRAGMGMPPRLVSVPVQLLRVGGSLTGRGETVSALVDDLVVDPAPFMRAFGWEPGLTTQAGIERSGRRFAEVSARD